MVKKKEEKKEKKAEKEVFDLTRAGQARPKDEAYKMYYTRVLRGEKRLKGEIKRLSPDAVIKDFNGAVNKDRVTHFINEIELGRRPALPVLDKVHGHVNGVHRAIAAKELGMKKIPVLVCEIELLACEVEE